MTAGVEAAELLQALGVDALLVTSPPNVRYLSGFTTPADGRVLVTPAGAVLVTDGRYEAQAAEESRLEQEIRREWLPWVTERAGSGRLGVEADAMTVALYEDLRARTSGSIVPLRGVLRDRRLVKTDAEIALLRRAAAIADAAFDHILGTLRPGIAEVEVALELERFMRLNGAEGAAFEIIVASGHRSAMAHGVASTKTIAEGELVTFDFGAKVGGYHGDMTRTVAVGAVSDEHRRIYDAVLEAQVESLAAVKPGALGREVDAVARRALERHGLAERFGHSLGHGVGLEIHEGPRLAASSDETLAPGMVVTVEPGVYVPGFAGVRIEDLVLVTESGHEVLSASSKELITVE